VRSLQIIEIVFALSAVSARGMELSDFVGGRGRNWDAIKVLEQGDAEMRAGNFQTARRDFDSAIRSDPTLWVAIFWRARLSAGERKWQEVIRDCNEVLRQESTFVEAAVLRASANRHLGNYSASLRDLDNVIRLQPVRIEAFAFALDTRAWIRATCPDPSLRNGKLAITDATKACNMIKWQSSGMIDTLAAAYAESGDYDSAIRYQEKAMNAAGAGQNSRELQDHMALFKQHRPVRSSGK
jgi:tetratricopeptide (TPR) repeat protein